MIERILKKYSNNTLVNATGLPLSFIKGYRKKIFRNPMLIGIENEIKKGIKNHEAIL